MTVMIMAMQQEIVAEVHLGNLEVYPLKPAGTFTQKM